MTRAPLGTSETGPGGFVPGDPMVRRVAGCWTTQEVVMDGRNKARGRSMRRVLAVVGIVAATVAATGAAPTSAADRRPPRPATTDVHVLAFNDFHGNLEPGTLNIYGQFAGGAAWLAQAIGEKQALYGDRSLTVHRR